MPVINREAIFIGPNEQFIRIIKVDSAGEFSCDLPPQVAVFVGFDVVRGKTKQEVIGKFSEALQRFRESKTSTRRVLLYRVAIGAVIMRDDRCVLRCDDISFTNTMCVGVSCAVYRETKIENKNGVRYTYEQEESKLPRSLAPRRYDTFGPLDSVPNIPEHCMEWTQEREDFFARLGLAMENIALELAKLKSTENTEKIIAAGGFKMLPPSK